jgi:hypothetical protein
MVDDDGAARGREAALKVRRMKLSDRRARVAELYPELSTTEIAAELGCAQSTIANDIIALGISAPVGPRRKYPEPEPRQCEECGVTFRPTASQIERGYGKLCSEECKRHRGGRRATTERHARADERLERMNAAGYLTMRQTADEIKCAESALQRYVELGYLAVGSLKLIEGEWWRLVRREELERFKAEEWPAIRARHTELRREDLERGWPALPSTWRPKTHRRHKNRVHGLDGGRHRLDEQSDYDETLQMIRDKYDATRASERDLGREFGVSRRMVRIALGRTP